MFDIRNWVLDEFYSEAFKEQKYVAVNFCKPRVQLFSLLLIYVIYYLPITPHSAERQW